MNYGLAASAQRRFEPHHHGLLGQGREVDSPFHIDQAMGQLDDQVKKSSAELAREII